MGKYFGTDGVRGLANEVVTPELAYRIGRFIGQYPNGKKNRILLARDTRLSGKMLSSALKSGIVTSGSDVYDLEVSTTPSISYLVNKEKFDYGVMISASHNPFYDNGIKIFSSTGEKLAAEIEAKIEEYLDADKDYLPLMVNEKIGRCPNARHLIDKYMNFLATRADPRITGLRILVDCANGSASLIAPKLFALLGLNAELLHSTPNGLNINKDCGSTHISNLLEYAENGDYDAVFAFDGDADRCLAIDDKNVVLDGDGIIYISALHMKKHRELNGMKVVLSVMSNMGLKKALKKEQIDYVEVGVGDKYVQAALKENNYSLGGEQSGHIIYADDLNTGDGFLTMIKILNTMVSARKPLSVLRNKLKIYPQKLVNIEVKDKDAIMNDSSLKELIKVETDKLQDNGRILIRPSGTEQLIRVMCEAESDEECERICEIFNSHIRALLEQ